MEGGGSPSQRNDTVDSASAGKLQVKLYSGLGMM